MNTRWLFLTLLVSSVATCGQKGPLQPPDTATTPALSAAFTQRAG